MIFVILSSMNVNYILHIVLRSSKFFGVLIFNFIVKSKENKITSKDLIFGFFFTIGVLLFSITGSKGKEQPTSIFGLICAATAFFLDGAVSYFQGKTRNKNMPTISSLCFMQMTNFWCLISSILFCLMKNSLYNGFVVLLQNPDVFLLMIGMACLAIVGQFFTFDHINRFGPVSVSLIQTLRKIFSIVFSIMIFSHPMTINRYLGLGFIFMILISNSFGIQIVNWLNKKLGSKKKKQR